MSGTADKTDPSLWEKVKRQVTASDKGGKPGQWSARKAQLAVHDYKQEGGGYKGKKSTDNHLTQWTEEQWGTKSGKPSLETAERYLPKAAREALSPDEYRRTSAKKRADMRKGKQASAQPRDVAEKTSHSRKAPVELATGRASKAALYAEAKRLDIEGRSKMSKDELVAALLHASERA
ncbi:DUF5872 domain-containing protein [Lichenifustis flavocetrariae]|uniref:DUF5872 domain-containing protein n=1 Tax=Lichenifustis flavocetrariae TaxID=2949735 RepID=A0AA42CLJ3_9HYPH|nr:DUF5872 domain-containing protein [Lichenifustis flavocetrariae]MCW6507427.1 DUF5872 domain-containing protein [Lichenifustis flavocetrariae]